MRIKTNVDLLKFFAWSSTHNSLDIFRAVHGNYQLKKSKWDIEKAWSCQVIYCFNNQEKSLSFMVGYHECVYWRRVLNLSESNKHIFQLPPHFRVWIFFFCSLNREKGSEKKFLNFPIQCVWFVMKMPKWVFLLFFRVQRNISPDSPRELPFEIPFYTFQPLRRRNILKIYVET